MRGTVPQENARSSKREPPAVKEDSKSVHELKSSAFFAGSHGMSSNVAIFMLIVWAPHLTSNADGSIFKVDLNLFVVFSVISR
jgi:hypothetical protein